MDDLLNIDVGFDVDQFKALEKRGPLQALKKPAKRGTNNRSHAFIVLLWSIGMFLCLISYYGSSC